MRDTRENSPAKTSAPLKTFARRRVALYVAGAALLVYVYLLGVPHNPPGFFVDEASIAYNAHTIAQTGADEHGEAWPLYFRAFGEYKSPVYIYLLAALFKLTGPSILSARLLSASAGLLAAALLGALAARAARNTLAGVAVFVTVLLTPWLFEISRLVFEVALLPAALALFLLLLHDASTKADWAWPRAAALGSALGLVTYTYSGGRLLAPLFAVGLLFFVTRERWRDVLRAWLAYGLTLVPLFVFVARRPGALGERFKYVTYVTPESTWAEIVLRFAANYAGNFSPWSWLVEGDPEPRHHVAGMGSLLAATFMLSAVGFILVVVRHRREAWWRFVLYGLFVSAVPASLTLDRFHTLRLAALPVFLLILVAPAVAWLAQERGRRTLLVALLALTLLQGALFQRQFQRAAPTRWHNFDAFYPEVFDAATSLPNRPVYVIDAPGAPGYMLAYWYATLRGTDTREFVRLDKDARPPSGALVISTETPCAPDCQMILHRGPFRAYIAK